MNSRDWKYILATQKKIMSYPVTKSDVGKYLFTFSSSWFGHPKNENGQRADENHVSKTSSSLVH
jgi:hypothetical protein